MSEQQTKDENMDSALESETFEDICFEHMLYATIPSHQFYVYISHYLFTYSNIRIKNYK